MANTYNGVVPGPALVVKQGDTVVIDYTNDGAIADSIHLHGVHEIPVEMDGVGGISQPLVPTGGHFVTASSPTRPDVHLSHARRRSDARLRALRRDHRRAGHPRPSNAGSRTIFSR